MSTVTPASIGAAASLGLIELRSPSGLRLQLLPSGAVHALRHEPILLNQFLPGPAEDGWLRLLVRRHDRGQTSGVNAIGPTWDWRRRGALGVTWTSRPAPGLHCTVELALHPTAPGWRWRIELTNTRTTPLEVDAVLAHDVGLADDGAVRSNEAYTSQYIDLWPAPHERLGWVVCARQNQPAAGRHPWLGLACVTHAAHFATDASQVFGPDHRLTGEPVALRRDLPDQRLQGEAATLALQSSVVVLPPRGSQVIEYRALFTPDHPDSSGEKDVARLAAWAEQPWPEVGADRADEVPERTAAGIFVTSEWIHGRDVAPATLPQWFPGPWRHEERDAAGVLQSFFCGEETHVVLRAKEAVIARPHGHILRSGDSLWLERDHLGVTCYASGQFAAQVYIGNTNLARLLSVTRHPLSLARASGQRVFVRIRDQWRQLGVPSAFALDRNQARWWYQLSPSLLITARLWCERDAAACCLQLEVVEGPPVEFLLTHQVVMGANEFEQPARVVRHPEPPALLLRPDPSSMLARGMPQLGFVVAALADETRVAGDGPLYPDGKDRDGPYVCLVTPPVRRAGTIMVGGETSDAALVARATQLRDRLRAQAPGDLAQPPPAPVRLVGGPEAARVDAVLPWFTHNAWIHFSAPHGLEQAGGAAWGVRDVCQGSIEWLLAAGQWTAARRVLLQVFSRQFADGSWPQWFMHDPFRWIQSHHSHGDVCLWPLKALCDYLEASGDLGLLDERCRYSDVETAAPVDANDTVLEHAARILLHVATRLVPGTALINYGDGDWDDTLQPADPAMRTRMISAWTVALSYQTFRQFAEACRRAGAGPRAQQVQDLVRRIRQDFVQHLMPEGIAAGFLVRDEEGDRVLLHPRDDVTGIQYRLLPMTRAILAELFTADEAMRHLKLVRDALWYPDGVRLMNAPAAYHGGRERWFKRGDTAANVGREIGLQYVHAHLRYAEALAKLGDAEGLWWALQVVNPVQLAEILPHAAPRQANVYFSSSDADFPDRIVAARRWSELRDGRVKVRGGWRLYSSGPGLFLHKVRACLCGVREWYDDVVLDPVWPAALQGTAAHLQIEGHPVALRVGFNGAAPATVRVRLNGELISADRREANPYRLGGILVPRALLRGVLRSPGNQLDLDA